MIAFKLPTKVMKLAQRLSVFTARTSAARQGQLPCSHQVGLASNDNGTYWTVWAGNGRHCAIANLPALLGTPKDLSFAIPAGDLSPIALPRQHQELSVQRRPGQVTLSAGTFNVRLKTGRMPSDARYYILGMLILDRRPCKPPIDAIAVALAGRSAWFHAALPDGLPTVAVTRFDRRCAMNKHALILVDRA